MEAQLSQGGTPRTEWQEQELGGLFPDAGVKQGAVHKGGLRGTATRRGIANKTGGGNPDVHRSTGQSRHKRHSTFPAPADSGTVK